MDSKTLALIATIVLATTMTFNSTNNSSSWESYKAAHGKVYTTAEEESYRQAIFMMNEAEVNRHNADNSQTYKKGINHLSDLTQEEFQAIYLGYKAQSNIVDAEDDGADVVGDVNWVTKGKVQRVKNQGQCGSCWAFSTVASSESLKAINEGTLGDFSEQQLVDCSGSYGNNGCSGGLMDNGFKYFRDNGICTESSYPYTAVDGTCTVSSCTKDSFTINGYQDVSGTAALKQACNKQPVSIGVDATQWSSYSSGIFSNCGTSLDHGVLLAGYTSSYWLVKNSWGASWGESGYIRLASGNTCGLANSPSVPTA